MSIGQVVVFIHELGPTSVKWYYGQLNDKKIFKGAPLKIYSSELKQIQTPAEWVSYLGTTPPTMLEIENPRGFFRTAVGINSWSLVTPSNYVIPVLRMLDTNPAYQFLVTDLTEMAYTAPLATQPAATGRRPYAEVKFENKAPVVATTKPKKGMSVRWANNDNADSVGAVGKEGEEDAETAAARRMLERAVIGSKTKAKTVVAPKAVTVSAPKPVAVSAPKPVSVYKPVVVENNTSSVRAVGKYDNDSPIPTKVVSVKPKSTVAPVVKTKEEEKMKKAPTAATAAEKRKATLAAKRLEEEERARKEREGFLAYTAAKLAKGKIGSDSVFSQAGV